MSLSHPLRCAFSASRPKPHHPLRKLHHSSKHHARYSPKYPSIKASDMGLVSDDSSATPKKDLSTLFQPYTRPEKSALSKKYTPSQLEAIEAGEAAIDPKDLAMQAAVRHDPMSLNYLDDFSSIQPVIDKPVRAPESNYDPNLRFREDEELVENLDHLIENMPDRELSEEEATRFLENVENMRLTAGKEEAELNPHSSLAPEIPKFTNRYNNVSEDEETADPRLQRLMKQTGFTMKQIKRFRVKQLVFHRVVNQTRMGKISSLYSLAVAGNQKGLVGIGEGKASEPEDSQRQAILAAMRNLTPIPRYEDRTIYGDVKGKVGGTELVLMNRPPGFGIRCQHNIYEICKCVGISDLAARVTRSRNPMNTIKATIKALLSQRLPEDIARARGRKLVDVRKVYYGVSVG